MYSRCGSYQALSAASKLVRSRPVVLAILESHENHEWIERLGKVYYNRIYTGPSFKESAISWHTVMT